MPRLLCQSSHDLHQLKKLYGYRLSSAKHKIYIIAVEDEYGNMIRYEYGDNSNHAHIGGEILKRNNYKYWKEVYYHGDIISEYTSMFLEILNKADMQIDKYGNDVGYDKRLEDIKNRYGEESKTYCDAKILIEKLRGNYNG